MCAKHLEAKLVGAMPLIITVALAFVLTEAPAGAQSSGFAPAAGTAGAVSVRELKISPKARQEFQRGLQRLAKNDAAGSLRHFAAATGASPNFYEAYYNDGVAESWLGHNDKALSAFQSAVDLSDGRYPRAEFGYALTLCHMGNAREAERVVRHGLETEPNVPDGYVVLSTILFELNRLDEAEKSAIEALRLNGPGSAKGHLLLADVYGARGDFDGEARELTQYLKLCPKDRQRDSVLQLRDRAKKLGKARWNLPY